ncbi:hypothetical protein VTN02DRAFT_6588 [Thermoascus thermophilus]
MLGDERSVHSKTQGRSESYCEAPLAQSLREVGGRDQPRIQPPRRPQPSTVTEHNEPLQPLGTPGRTGAQETQGQRPD